jgi:hypothetical protein
MMIGKCQEEFRDVTRTHVLSQILQSQVLTFGVGVQCLTSLSKDFPFAFLHCGRDYREATRPVLRMAWVQNRHSH